MIQKSDLSGSDRSAASRCPSCGSSALSVFYTVRDVPVHTVHLVRSRAQALEFPTGNVALAFCTGCGFITNHCFDPSAQAMSGECEVTQAFSDTFNAFHTRLASDLIARHNLRQKTILEFGCGGGEFLSLLCEMGGNRGIGLDPAYEPGRIPTTSESRIRFIRDVYRDQYGPFDADFVCCKMTLEHIHDTAGLLNDVRRSIGRRSDTVVFFQIPEVRRILRDLAFWDVYYDHCSYFSKGSLARLFQGNGFDVIDVWTDYDDQYLMIEARPGRTSTALGGRYLKKDDDDLDDVAREVDFFSHHIGPRLDAWRHAFRAMQARGERVALWGGGSKAVAFLTTLGVTKEVTCVVDVNPYKHGTFLPGSGHQVVSPSEMQTFWPDSVIIMNPIYHDEIESDLARFGLFPALLHADAKLTPGTGDA